jgi:hypothetical protein
MLANGATSNSSPYVTVPVVEPARTPPMFMTSDFATAGRSIGIRHEIPKHLIGHPIGDRGDRVGFTIAWSGAVTARTSESITGSGLMRSGRTSRKRDHRLFTVE